MSSGDVDVHISGPIFGPGAEAAFRDFVREVEQNVSSQILSDWQQGLNSHIRHATPYYETQLMVRAEPGGHIVTDRGIVYGPWLEGTSRRNSTTRFRGYGQLRAARQSINGKLNGLIAYSMSRVIARLGGGA